jgi:hypothetical protein
MNQIMKSAMLSGVLALCATLVGCMSPSSSSSSQAQASQTEAPAVSAQPADLECDQFCMSQGGQFFEMTFATSEQQCDQKGGEWFESGVDYPGPPPGCCCKCALLGGEACD